MVKSCKEYQELIQDRLAGELEPSLEADLSAHLAECAGCARESELLQGVWKELAAYEDLPVPGHFFVYEQERLSTRDLLARLSIPWRLAMGAACASLLVAAALVLSNVVLTIQPDAVIVGFGAVREQTPDLERLRVDLTEHLKTVSQQERSAWIDMLRSEFEDLLAQSEEAQRQLVGTALDELESRTLQAARVRDLELQARLDASLKSFGSALLTRHEKDMGEVRQRLNQFANYNRYQANQTGAIMATLVEMAETRSN